MGTGTLRWAPNVGLYPTSFSFPIFEILYGYIKTRTTGDSDGRSLKSSETRVHAKGQSYTVDILARTVAWVNKVAFPRA